MLICLDLDGTLEDSRTDMVAAVHRVRAAMGLPIRTDEAVRPHVAQGMEALYRACFDDALAGGTTIEAVAEAYEADYLAHVADQTRLYDGIAEVLKDLSELGHLAVVTNKPEQISRRLLEVLKVGEFIDTVVGGDTAGVVKPDPLMMRCAAEDVDAVGEPAVMIGDTAADVKMGRAFGAKTIWCAWGYAADPGGETPDARAAHPRELPGLVKTVFETKKEIAR